MRVKRLNLLNFRGVASLDLDFTQRTTAFAGVNGVGKSTILDALAIALSQLTWRINRMPNRARPIALEAAVVDRRPDRAGGGAPTGRGLDQTLAVAAARSPLSVIARRSL